MVIWDTNILALFFGGRLDQDDTLRVKGLIAELRRKREPIGIPAQVWAEFIEEAQPRELESSQDIFKSSAFKLLPYDMRAALETAEISRIGRNARKQDKGAKRPRQSVKVDWQIIAIAKVHRARMLLTNDADVITEAARSGVAGVRVSDLPIPDGLRQHPLEFADQEQ